MPLSKDDDRAITLLAIHLTASAFILHDLLWNEVGWMGYVGVIPWAVTGYYIFLDKEEMGVNEE